MRKFKLHLTDESYSQRQKTREYSRINRCVMNMKREIDLEVFAEEAGENGKWFIPALYDGGKENFLQQEVFVLNTSDSIHLIKAQTALGKTTVYCAMAQRWRGAKPFMIAVPTIKLQNEVHGRLAACGVDAEMTPSIEGFLEGFGDPGLQAEVSTLYEKGFGYRVKRRIKEYIKENEDMLAPEQVYAYETYQKRFPKFDGSCCIVTTHAMLLALQERELRKYEIIVDEDILMTIFKNTDAFSFQDMEAILHEGTHLQVLKDRIREILGMEDGSMGNTDLSELDPGSLDQLYEEDLPVVSSIPDFIASSSFYVDVEHEQVHYFRAKKSPM